MNKLIIFFQKIGSFISTRRFNHQSKKIRSPYNHIIPNLITEIRKYDKICNIYKNNKIEVTRYLEWRARILELLRKVDDETELINFSHYLRLLARNYETTTTIPSQLIEFILGIVLGAFLQWEDLKSFEKSIPIFLGILLAILIIFMLKVIFSITSRRPSDFCNDVIEIIGERIEELNEK
ncbi:MAG: hypothetical protein IKH75_10370 [Ruminococcus sp.]|nr:hypothetical protein [Ruminococcus sp.]